MDFCASFGCAEWRKQAFTRLAQNFREIFVGADGFEPPKSKDSRFTVCPIWPLWNTPNFKDLGASSRTRTNDRWITNLVLYQLSYRGIVMPIVNTLPTKKRAKVLLFFDMTKYFAKKIKKNAFLFIFATSNFQFPLLPSTLNPQLSTSPPSGGRGASFARGWVAIYTRLICSKVVWV